jgi:hypothetical protein
MLGRCSGRSHVTQSSGVLRLHDATAPAVNKASINTLRALRRGAINRGSTKQACAWRLTWAACYSSRQLTVINDAMRGCRYKESQLSFSKERSWRGPGVPEVRRWSLNQRCE